MKTAKHGEFFEVRLVDPSALQEMEENTIVVVNRVRLNSKVVEFEIQNVRSEESTVLKAAIRSMKERESRLKVPAIGAEMRVGDIRRVFPEYKSFPKNTFYLDVLGAYK